MNEKFPQIEEKITYPKVDVRCEECGKWFSGEIGPIDGEHSYPLVKYIWPNPLLNELLTHHNTNRMFSKGHNSFHVFFQGQNIGKAKVASNAQLFVRARKT